MANFDFLQLNPEYALFSSAAIEAEKVFHTSPAMCAIGCRKAVELGVKWVYSAERLEKPSQDQLQILIHNPEFHDILDGITWERLPYVIKLGNLAVHSDKAISRSEALLSLCNLFDFIDWIDYTYSANYPENGRKFDKSLIPTAEVALDTKKIKEQESILKENEEEIERLRAELSAKSAELAALREENRRKRPEYVSPDEMSEFETRKHYIDLDLKYIGWTLDGHEVQEEYPVDNMAGVPGKHNGFIDYVLFGKDGNPLAIIEAKKTTVNPIVGKNQAELYADCLEQKFGVRPMIFLSNGLSTWFWDKESGPEHQVGGFFSRQDLERLMLRRHERKDLMEIQINREITGRPYQMEAIRAICERLGEKFNKLLVVMATGTGKTRTAASAVDVLSRGNRVTNVLFLADRTALVAQAMDAFKTYLPEMSLCNLLEGKDDKDARIVFSTYPTMMNAIDTIRSKDAVPLYSPGHFDLIIIDECHRSIFNKYRAIFEYFDAILLGLTATPKNDVDASTYEFFDCEDNIPTFAYDYETAVYRDHVLVPYYNIEVKTNFLDKGIHYDELSEADKLRYEEYFSLEDGKMPDFIDAKLMNTLIFNKKTVDMVLNDLMTNGIKVAGGDRIAKTIIFAQNMNHAQFIVDRFNHLYPQYGGTFCKRVVSDDAYAQKVIDDFKFPKPPAHWSADMEKNPQIIVSVDMLDTGIDVPQIGNLVFFKKVFSKIKFWQMIGRGTRLCPDMDCVDGQNGEYSGKKYFYIFDYCGNFEFFRERPHGIEGSEAMSLSQSIFTKRVNIIAKLQEYQDQKLQEFRQSLVAICHGQVNALNPELAVVRMHREDIEEFRDINSFLVLDEEKIRKLTKIIAPMVSANDTDEYAKRYDNTVYSLILDALNGEKDIGKASGKLTTISLMLSKKGTIPQVANKMSLIQETSLPDYWALTDVIGYDYVRSELRGLIKFISDTTKKPVIFTGLNDAEKDRREGNILPPSDDYDDYKTRVNRYIYEHGDTMVIYKLTHNKPLTEDEFDQLERILTVELGTKEDYQKNFKEKPFGILVREVAHMDHDSVMDAFAEFINSENLNVQQIAFVNKVVSYIEKNGYVQNIGDLLKPPFDKPSSFIILFDEEKQRRLIGAINKIRENAEKIA